jgi:hypothetical protein
MEINNSSNKLGIYQEVDDICGTNLTSYPIESKTRRANSALSDFVGVALGSDDRWQFDDTNYTDFPIGVTNLRDGQNDYSFETQMLKVLKVELLDPEGNLTELKPIDRNDVGTPLSEIFTEEGTPLYYDKFANSAILYPTPSYNSTGGLKVYYQRDGSYFASTDTTKAPGIPSIFHKYIALKVALPFLRDKGKENYVSVRNEVQVYEEITIPEFYAKRNKDERPTLSGRVVDYK